MKPLALLAASLLAFGPTAPVVLRRALRADAVDVYKIEDRVQQSVRSSLGETPSTIASTRTFTLRTTKVDEAAGTARFEATTVVEKLAASGDAGKLLGEKPAPVVQTGKLDVRGRMSFDPSGALDPLTSLTSGTPGGSPAGLFVEFSERAVAIGDSWDVVVPKNPFVYDADQRLTATLTGEKEIDGVAVWTVRLKGTLKTAVDSGRLPAVKGADPSLAAPRIRVRGQDDLVGEGIVEKATGRTISMTFAGATARTIELVDSGITLDASGKLESTVKLQKG